MGEPLASCAFERPSGVGLVPRVMVGGSSMNGRRGGGGHGAERAGDAGAALVAGAAPAVAPRLLVPV